MVVAAIRKQHSVKNLSSKSGYGEDFREFFLGLIRDRVVLICFWILALLSRRLELKLTGLQSFDFRLVSIGLTLEAADSGFLELRYSDTNYPICRGSTSYPHSPLARLGSAS